MSLSGSARTHQFRGSRTKISWALALVFAAATCSVGCGDSERRSDRRGSSLGEHRTQPIEGGTREEGLRQVVGISLSETPACTGTLVAPNLVLTAGHCIAEGRADSDERVCKDGFSSTRSPESLGVTTKTDMRSAIEDGAMREVAAVSIPESVEDCGGDIGVIRLVENIDGSGISFATPSLDTPPERGDQFTAVGYGGNGTDPVSEGIRRSYSGARVNCVGGGCPASDVPPSLMATDAPTCEGDSGGPALVRSPNRVLGVASLGFNGCGNGGYVTAYHWREWLRRRARRAADAGGYPVPDWAGGSAGDGGISRDGGGDAYDGPDVHGDAGDGVGAEHDTSDGGAGHGDLGGDHDAAPPTRANSGGTRSGCSTTGQPANSFPWALLFVAVGFVALDFREQ